MCFNSAPPFMPQLQYHMTGVQHAHRERATVDTCAIIKHVDSCQDACVDAPDSLQAGNRFGHLSSALNINVQDAALASFSHILHGLVHRGSVSFGLHQNSLLPCSSLKHCTARVCQNRLHTRHCELCCPEEEWCRFAKNVPYTMCHRYWNAHGRIPGTARPRCPSQIPLWW